MTPEAFGSPLDRRAEGMAGLLLDCLLNPAAPLSVKRLCLWHKSLFPESHPDVAAGQLRPGSFRVESKASEDLAIIHLMGVPREHLVPELHRFVEWFNDQDQTLDGLVRASIAHLWFVTLHPFDDGNGQIARARADLALTQERSTDPLDQAPGLISSHILLTRHVYYAALQADPCHSTFCARHRETPFNERQRKVLNRLLDAEPDGFQDGMTTRNYVSLTHCSPITASRDLAELTAAGILRSAGAGRTTAYAIPGDDLVRT